MNRIIGAQLRTLRKRAGLSQVQVARNYGAPQSFVSKIECGERSLALAEALPYAHALGISDEQLYREVRHALIRTARRR